MTELGFEVTGDPGTQINAWVDEVDQLSKGRLKISFVRRDAHAGDPAFEAETIADVRAGAADLAWVGSRAFDKAGLDTFQPLGAPMLIDSLELEGKVFDAGIPQALLPSLSQRNLVGVGILPGPIRKLLGVTKPFTKPGDFTGQVVGIQASGVAEQTFIALGARTKAVPGSAELTDRAHSPRAALPSGTTTTTPRPPTWRRTSTSGHDHWSSSPTRLPTSG